MEYIENMFKDAGIDVKYDVKEDYETEIKGTYQIGSFCISFKYGDEVDGFKYNRELCIYDCQINHKEVIKIIENDIRLIKPELRRVKLKQLGI
jgi:hypothetical protein